MEKKLVRMTYFQHLGEWCAEWTQLSFTWTIKAEFGHLIVRVIIL